MVPPIIMSIKSVHITNYYHKNSGGISTAYNAILAAAGRHERLVRLIVPGEEKAVEEVNDFAKIYYVPAKYSPFFDKRYRVMMPWDYMLHGSSIREILIEEQPDMVEVRDKYTLSVFGAMVRKGEFRDLGRPMLVGFSSERMSDNIESFLFGGKVSRWFSRRVMGNYYFALFDYHIANSSYTADELRQAVLADGDSKRQNWFFNMCWRFLASPRVPVSERINVCPSGIDTSRFSPERKSAEARERIAKNAGVPEDAVLLLYSGRISPEKNVKLLLELMQILDRDDGNDYRLLVAGSGPQADWLKEQTESLVPGRIIQLGHLSKPDLADHYANVDVFVHPNDKEPYGLVPLEAMASGVPTVLPNAGGVLTYATNENSWLAEPTGEDFARQVRAIAENPSANADRVEMAIRAANENSFEKFTDRLFGTYDRLWEDFQERNELFTDFKTSKSFDFTSVLESNSRNQYVGTSSGESSDASI